MKNFLLVCLFIITFAVLAGGKMYWDGQLNSVLAETVSVKAPNQSVKSEANGDPEKAAAKKEKMIKLDRLNYLPPELQQKFREKINQDKPLHLMILGSSSTSEQKGAWSDLLENRLMDVYGNTLLNVTVNEIANKTSTEIVEENLHKELVKQHPDILLLEPFLLYGIEEIGMKKRLNNLTAVLEDFKKGNPDLTIIIQPANPIYGAHYYLEDEKELQKYAEHNKYIYLDHWKAWPASDEKEIKDYLTNESLPNKKGNEAWAEFLINYFVREI
ncbi:SGNH/GDSL hydrolase family protein [Rossellomorea aquimaris]|nr:SGNH/GDSL hydrolase family protein [Rossellomorea aquimaris]